MELHLSKFDPDKKKVLVLMELPFLLQTYKVYVAILVEDRFFYS